MNTNFPEICFWTLDTTRSQSDTHNRSLRKNLCLGFVCYPPHQHDCVNRRCPSNCGLSFVLYVAWCRLELRGYEVYPSIVLSGRSQPQFQEIAQQVLNPFSVHPPALPPFPPLSLDTWSIDHGVSVCPGRRMISDRPGEFSAPRVPAPPVL